MAEYKETKPDSKLVSTPVEGLCGNPDDRSGGAGVEHGGESVQGQPKESEGTQTVTYYNEAKG